MTDIRRALQVLSLLTLGFSLSLQANNLQVSPQDHRLGVYLSASEQELLTDTDLQDLRELGFSILEVEGLAPRSILQFTEEAGQFLFVRQDRRFTTSHQLLRNDSLYLTEDVSLIQSYRNELAAREIAFCFFVYPAEQSATVPLQMDQYMRSLSELEEAGGLSYYRTAWSNLEQVPASFSFRSTRLPAAGSSLPSGVIHFDPADTSPKTLLDLKELLELSLNAEQSIILLPYQWVSLQTEHFPLLRHTLITYNRDGNILFPEPHLQNNRLSLNWMVILWVVLLGSYLIHYRLNPVYRSSLFRSFFTHKMFVENILESRLRMRTATLVLFFQNLLICGIAIYLIVSSFISPLGLEALFHHFPVLSLFGEDATAFFFLGLFAALFLQLISVGWIHLFNRTTRFSQVLALYSWPLHLNFIIIMIMIAVYQGEGPPGWILAMAIAFLFTWFASFNIAALDIAKHLQRFRVLYILFTVGLHLFLIVLLTTLLLYYGPVSEPLRLALALTQSI